MDTSNTPTHDQQAQAYFMGLLACDTIDHTVTLDTTALEVWH